jgi:hypothetical protein
LPKQLQWVGVILHLNDARVPGDNNAGESAMRPIALEQK